jgi:hypothetical protein
MTRGRLADAALIDHFPDANKRRRRQGARSTAGKQSPHEPTWDI